MAEYEFTGAKWGGGSLGTSGGQVTWSFATLPGAFYKFDAAISQLTYQNLVRDAFQVWEDVADIDFLEVVDSSFAKIRLGWDYVDGRYSTVGEAKYSYWEHGAVDALSKAEIRFDTAEVWSTAKHYVAGTINFFAVAVHEIGHALGLAHSDAQDTIMFPTIGTQVGLSPGDIAGAQALYCTKASSASDALVAFTGTTLNDVYSGTSVGEIIFGNGGNDRLAGGGGNDWIDGGSGVDTVVFGGRIGRFSLSLEGAADITVVDLRPGAIEGTDTLVAVERLEFDDGTLAFDFAGTAGQAYRLYQAAFDRAPDTGGLGYWIKQLDSGTGDLHWAADSFQNSQEFRAAFGAPAELSDDGFIALLYQNVLDRAPDTAGFQYWLKKLDEGLDRGLLLASFSESSENIENVAGAIADGIWYF